MIDLDALIIIRKVTIENIIIVHDYPEDEQIFYAYDRISPFISERDVFKTFEEAQAAFKLRVGEAH
jgi:hypothetical protein